MTSEAKTFKDLGLSEWLVNSCSTMGIHTPTEIQQRCIPQILNGKDVIGRAKTGSGKTAAFALPILEIISRDPFGVFAVVLTPARELAIQIAEQFSALGKSCNLKVCVVIGGQDMMTQSIALASRPHIVIATPGRLADHIRSGSSVDLRNVQFAVLDEADRLLESSFKEDLTTVLESLPSDRRVMLFSATITKDMRRLQSLAMSDAVVFEASSEFQFSTVDLLEQQYTFGPQGLKECYLVHVLQEDQHAKASIIVFVASCKNAQTLAEMLLQLEIPCVALHSGVNQRRRLAALGKFRSGKSRILIATDVASRGLDIPEVQLVINFDLPRNPTDYVHRVGRTARAGRHGCAITVLSQYDLQLLEAIEKHTGKKMTEHEVKSDDVTELFKTVNPARRMARMRLDQYTLKERPSTQRKRKLASKSR